VKVITENRYFLLDGESGSAHRKGNFPEVRCWTQKILTQPGNSAAVTCYAVQMVA